MQATTPNNVRLEYGVYFRVQQSTEHDVVQNFEKRSSTYFVSNMASSSRVQVLALYRMLIKESKRFPSYNYRYYFH